MLDDGAYAAYLADAHRLGAGGAGSRRAGDSRPGPPVAAEQPPPRRLAAEAARRLLIGFNAEASHRIVDMRECHVLRPELFALVAPLRRLLGPAAARRREDDADRPGRRPAAREGGRRRA